MKGLILFCCFLNANFYHVFVEIVTEGKRKKPSSSELHKVCISFALNFWIIFRVNNI